MSISYPAPQPRSTARSLAPWAIALVGLVALCGGSGIALVLWLALGPEGGVRLGNQMESYALEYIEKHRLLEEGEQIIAYYDVTISLSGEEAAILTDRRLLYHKEGRNTEIPLDEIERIEHRKEPILGDVLEVKGGGTRMQIEIAPLNNAPAFIEALRDESGVDF